VESCRVLASLGDRKFVNLKLQIAMANVVIHHFDAAQDYRVLSTEEWWLGKSLKQHMLGLSSLERTMARQRSRMRWLKDGDADSKLFHVVANGRRAKNFITHVKIGSEIITEQSRKEEAFYQAFDSLLG
jgi:hypothetical protein